MSSKSWGLDIRMWDVGLGDAIWANAASRDVIIDMGATSFSPLEHVESKTGVRTVDLMIVTHPHEDHIRDVVRYDDLDLRVSHLRRNKAHDALLEDKIEEEDDDHYLEIAGSYEVFVSKFTGPASIDPASEDFAEGATFRSFQLDRTDVDGPRYKQMNNLSLITVIERYGFKLVTAGDLMTQGIETIIDDREDIMAAIADADVLIAPHHGRDSGYVNEFVDHIDPHIVFISDKPDNGNNASAYNRKPTGVRVLNERTGEVSDDPRNAITTRNDGRLRVRANTREDWLISYYPHYAKDRAHGSMAQSRRNIAD